MNPDSNFSRELVPTVLSIASYKEQKGDPDQQIVSHNENQHVLKLRHQLEFYMGDANLSKDQFLQKKLESTTQIELSVFLSFNRIKSLIGSAQIGGKEEQLKHL